MKQIRYEGGNYPLHTFINDRLTVDDRKGKLENIEITNMFLVDAMSLLLTYLCESGILTAKQLAVILDMYEDSFVFEEE